MAKPKSAVENMAIAAGFWRGRRVLLTGHTGFKGSWLLLWLQQLGAEVHGFALAPEQPQGLFQAAQLASLLASECIADIAQPAAIHDYVQAVQPQLVFHLAAQPLVRESYRHPLSTFASNVMGTANLLEALRPLTSLRAVLVISSDKCYQNQSWPWGYRETDKLGGHDPYSASKACQELVLSSYRASFYAGRAQPQLATARAGNVIGGGDWSPERLLPDAMRALQTGQSLLLRAPDSIRPWQHVLDCLHGYLLLMQALGSVDGAAFAQAWNFGPAADDKLSVRQLITQLARHCDPDLQWTEASAAPHLQEADLLLLDSSLARSRLGWRPCWTAQQAIAYSADWFAAQRAGQDMRSISLQQLADFTAAIA
ncbi:CDP-glucose 4,6-dehydratase [Neisseriaceae bacterium TC5R-5]|nr:CDP-glucose 4,6-dehydratase [Neisseriaceae bacterium TC5R-5]